MKRLKMLLVLMMICILSEPVYAADLEQENDNINKESNLESNTVEEPEQSEDITLEEEKVDEPTEESIDENNTENEEIDIENQENRIEHNDVEDELNANQDSYYRMTREAEVNSIDSPKQEETMTLQVGNGWKKANGYTYYYKNGKKLTGWRKINGRIFYFKKSGTDTTKGSMLTGWRKVNGKTFYFKKSGSNGIRGRMLTGWRTISGKTFYFKKTGSNGTKGQMLSGLKTISGKRYYFRMKGGNGEKGKMLVGWQTKAGDKYYFKKSGKTGTRGSALTGVRKVGNQTYRFASNGKLIEKIENYKAVYQNYLKNAKDNGINYFIVINIDGKGAPELITFRGQYDETGNVYTVKDNKLRFVSEIWNKFRTTGICYNPTAKGLVMANGGSSAVGESLWKISGGRLVETVSVLAIFNSTTTYQYNYVECSKATYEKYYNKYFSEDKIVWYSKTANTVANRSAKIK